MINKYSKYYFENRPYLIKCKEERDYVGRSQLLVSAELVSATLLRSRVSKFVCVTNRQQVVRKSIKQGIDGRHPLQTFELRNS